MERDIHFFLVFHMKITNFRVNYIFTRLKKGSMACLGPGQCLGMPNLEVHTHVGQWHSFFCA